MNEPKSKLKCLLESLYTKYNQRRFIPPDPLQFVYRYEHAGDIEIVGLLAAVLAYGRVQQIEKSLNKLFGHMGKSPYEFVKGFTESQRAKFCSFKHRFTTGDDICDLLALLRKVLEKFGSIEKFFLSGYTKNDKNIIPALSNFCASLLDMHSKKHKGYVSRGLRYLLAHPAGGSACKRLNLFLRWMVRDDDVDVGLWRSVDKAKLIVPVDVHMARLCRILGFYDRKTVSLSAAVEITESFAEIEPNDPVKYDFALSRIGILGHCTGRLRKQCTDCELYEFCFELKGK